MAQPKTPEVKMPFASPKAILAISSSGLHILGEVKTQQLAGLDPEPVIDRDPEVVLTERSPAVTVLGVSLFFFLFFL
jgi:hypothetical protein